MDSATTDTHTHKLGTLRLRHHETNEVILIPSPTADPNDPLNWSRKHRYFLAVVACLAVFFCNFLAAGPSVAISETTIDFLGPMGPDFSSHVSQVSYFFTSAALCQGVGMLFWMPLIVKYGRRPIYVLSFLAYFGTALWCGFAQSYAVELTGRIVLGLTAGAGECLGPLTIADIFFLHERGTVMAIYTAALSMGVAGGPLRSYSDNTFTMARSILYSMLFASLVLASIIIEDPSNIVPPEDWADDNAYVFDWHTTGEAYQTIPIIGPYTYNQQTGAIDHRSLETTANDTSVVVIANRSDVTITHSTITKFGYSSALNQASFYGVNAAVNNANYSTLRLSNVNVTTHNGAANVYTYGTGSVTYADNTWLYSSGPVSHGFYAAGNGTIYAKDVQVYSGGTRCSAFSGDYPAGYIHAENAVVHTDGVGSAICFLQGLCNMTNVVGYAAKSPAMISDGALSDVIGIWKNSDLTAGLLGGIVMISDSTIRNGTTVVLDNTRLTVLGEGNPGLWFGNIIATVDLIAASINTSSGILAVSNYSFLTQDFDYYAGYEENNNLSPAQATINVKDSTLSGSLVAYNESSISFNLQSFSHWNGMAKVELGAAYLSVSLDNTSTWTLTGDPVLQSFANSNSTLTNVFSNGFDILYDSDSLVNAAWKGETYELQGGGKLRPS